MKNRRYSVDSTLGCSASPQRISDKAGSAVGHDFGPRGRSLTYKEALAICKRAADDCACQTCYSDWQEAYSDYAGGVIGVV